MTLARFGLLATVLAILSIYCASTTAATLKIHVSDPAGGSLSKALVIVRPLDANQPEVVRALTGADSRVPSVNVPSGLYEAIATYPYSPWKTRVQDFLVDAEPVTLELQL